MPADTESIRALVQGYAGGFGTLDDTVKRYLRRWFVSQGGVRVVVRHSTNHPSADQVGGGGHTIAKTAFDESSLGYIDVAGNNNASVAAVFICPPDGDTKKAAVINADYHGDLAGLGEAGHFTDASSRRQLAAFPVDMDDAYTTADADADTEEQLGVVAADADSESEEMSFGFGN